MSLNSLARSGLSSPTRARQRGLSANCYHISLCSGALTRLSLMERREAGPHTSSGLDACENVGPGLEHDAQGLMVQVCCHGRQAKLMGDKNTNCSDDRDLEGFRELGCNSGAPMRAGYCAVVRRPWCQTNVVPKTRSRLSCQDGSLRRERRDRTRPPYFSGATRARLGEATRRALA
jgi:hypothetical protein